MRAHGNGDKRVCTGNLLATVRGEVPFDRIRGVDSAVVDVPASAAEAAVKRDTAWMLETYEPRAKVKSIQVVTSGESAGSFTVTADII